MSYLISIRTVSQTKTGSNHGHECVTEDSFPNSREEFRHFCDDLGRIGGKAQKQSHMFSEDGLVLDIPCQVEFHRYIQWHNMAFMSTWDLGIPTGWRDARMDH